MVHELEHQKAQLSSLKQRVSPIINEIVIGTDTHLAANALGSPSLLRPSPVVEVLAFNRRVDHGPATLAAILTRRDGSSSTITTAGSLSPRTKEFRDTDTIRYDLSWRAPDSDGGSVLSYGTEFANTIINALWYREEEDRYFEVKEAHKRTFGWVFEDQHSELRNWLHTPDGLFWVNGKAGSAKSTLMKYIHRHSDDFDQNVLESHLGAWAGQRQLLVIGFFFWQAGDLLQRCYEGISRSLLRQIFQARPDLIPVVFPQLTRHVLLQPSQNGLQIKQKELEQGLAQLIRDLPADLALFIIVDGVDEYSGDQVEFSKLLARLAAHPAIKVLVSSRPVPECHYIFDGYPGLKLQDLTRTDIGNYIDAELISDKLFARMALLEDGFAAEVRSTLVEKASGVFLWTVLVVQRILLGLVHHEDREALLKRIDELPKDLEKLYDHMFGKMSVGYRADASMLLQVMMGSREIQTAPFSATQFLLAADTLKDLRNQRAMKPTNPHNTKVLIEILEGRLRSRCCGLIEVQVRDVRGPLHDPRAVFLHRTVFDYLRNPAIWNRIMEVCRIATLDLHRSLMLSCVQMLDRATASFQPSVMTESTIIGYFAATVQYARQLSLANAPYVDDLRRGIAMYRHFCDSLIGGRLDQGSIYIQGWKQTGLQPADGASSVSSWYDSSWSEAAYSQFVMAQFGLTELLKVEVSQLSARETAKLAIHLLDIATSRYSLDHLPFNSLQSCVDAVKVLLLDSVDPNQVVDEPRFVQRYGRDYATPWFRWILGNSKFESAPKHGAYFSTDHDLIAFSVNEEELRDMADITLLLLQAGAFTPSDYSLAVAAHRRWIAAFKRTRSLGHSEAVVSAVNKVIFLLESALGEEPARSVMTLSTDSGTDVENELELEPDAIVPSERGSTSQTPSRLPLHAMGLSATIPRPNGPATDLLKTLRKLYIKNEE